MKITTLEHYIKHTTIPYGTLLKRAKKGGLTVNEIPDTNGLVVVKDNNGREMRLYFEDTTIYEENKDNGLIASEYNYSK
jgi:hypothetical protein